MTPEQAEAFLSSRGPGVVPGLERIDALMELLDNPQLSFPTVHLAGTNGKTSTARMIATILAAHGLTVGLYTSPHLARLTERFCLAGWNEGLSWEEISGEQLVETLQYLLPLIRLAEDRRGEELTHFELTCALAFEWMAQRTVGVGVIEAGMGGRWDATNVIEAAVAVLTPIEVDHAQFLGSSPELNASEKVGIIKPGAVVVSADQRPEVAGLIQAAAAEKGATLVVEARDFVIEANEAAVGGRSVSIKTARAGYADLFLPLHGAHQGRNLALAIAAAEAIVDRAMDRDLLSAGLAAVTSPGRLEVVGRRPLVVLDGSHNPHGAAAIAGAIPESFLFDQVTIVFSIFADKDAAGILKPLLPLASRVIFTGSDSPRSAPPERLLEIAQTLDGSAQLSVTTPLEDALNLAIATSRPQDLVLVTGSLHAVGRARGHLSHQKG